MPARPSSPNRRPERPGRCGINIRMIAQGSEELDIIVGVDDADFEKAISVIYHGFIDSRRNMLDAHAVAFEALHSARPREARGRVFIRTALLPLVPQRRMQQA